MLLARHLSCLSLNVTSSKRCGSHQRTSVCFVCLSSCFEIRILPALRKVLTPQIILCSVLIFTYYCTNELLYIFLKNSKSYYLNEKKGLNGAFLKKRNVFVPLNIKRNKGEYFVYTKHTSGWTFLVLWSLHWKQNIHLVGKLSHKFEWIFSKA